MTTGMHVDVQNQAESTWAEQSAWQAGGLMATEARAFVQWRAEQLDAADEEFL